MPEGDTIHKLAARMRPELERATLDKLWLRDRGELRALRGATVTEVSALGKHLLIGLQPDGTRASAAHVLHVHLGMHGRWDRYAVGERWRRPAHQAVVQIASAEREWVCFKAGTHELLRAVDVATHPSLRRLGPDLLAEAFDARRILARARRSEPRTLSDLLLNQRVACGLGNVYKSEILFLEGLDPRARVDRIDDDTVVRCFATGRRLLAQNLGAWRRTTIRRVTPGTEPRANDPRFWVYGRAGESCRPAVDCGWRDKIFRRCVQGYWGRCSHRHDRRTICRNRGKPR